MTATDVARALYPALATGDREALDRLLSHDFLGDTEPGLPLELGGRYEGSAAMRREFWGALGRAFDVQALPGTFTEVDGEVLVEGTYVGAARKTGKRFEAVFTHRLSVQDGRITSLTQRTLATAWANAPSAACHGGNSYRLATDGPRLAHRKDVEVVRALVLRCQSEQRRQGRRSPAVGAGRVRLPATITHPG